jgi:hypothetical protein
MKMEQTECSETLAFKLPTPKNNPKENIRHLKYGGSLKSRTQTRVVIWRVFAHIIVYASVFWWTVFRILLSGDFSFI